MIVISGALVLVALVLLLVGLLQPELGFVYASIVVSLISFGFLIVGILQRRGETFGEDSEGKADAAAVTSGPSRSLPFGRGKKTADEPGPASPAQDDAVTVVAPAEVAPAATAADVVEEVSGTVMVVAGRPRYHVEGCRYLTGKDADEVEVEDAREEGFTACGVCKPDIALEQARVIAEDVPGTVGELDDASADGEEDLLDDGEEPAVEPAVVEVVPSARRATRKTAAPSAVPAPVVVAEPAVKLVEAPVTKASARTSAAKAPAAKAPAAKAPAKRATTVSAAKAAAAAAGVAAPAKPAAPRGSVVVIPDRGKFHTSECRYVRGVDGTQVMSKTAATRSGYDACGVCKP